MKSVSRNDNKTDRLQTSNRRFQSREKEHKLNEAEKVYNVRERQMAALLTDETLLHRRNDIYRVNKVLKPLQPFSKRYLQIALDHDEKRKYLKKVI